MLENKIFKVLKLKEICLQSTTNMLLNTLAAATDTATAERLQPHSITTIRGCCFSKSNNNSNHFSRTPTLNITTPTTTTAAQTLSITIRVKRKETARYHSSTSTAYPTIMSLRQLLLIPIFLLLSINCFSPAMLVSANVDFYSSTTPLSDILNTTAKSSQATENASTDFWQSDALNSNLLNGSGQNQTTASSPSSSSRQSKSAKSSFFAKFSKRLSTGNELWDGIITDCYQQPTISCFQKNVFIYLNDALDANDVNVTQRLKFYRNQVDFEKPTTEAAMSKDEDNDDDDDESGENNFVRHERENIGKELSSMGGADEHLLKNETPHTGRAAAETPIEEVTNALYGKGVKFAMTHDIEMQLPEMLFDGAIFRISPRSMEGNGVIAKLELIPKQEVEARLLGKVLFKKIQKFLKSKLMLSFLALVLIIKIIKIKLFWLLPIVIGVGAAKKLLLKFLLFLFPALSHLFKLCSYYQQTYHSTKYHHHHHLINHHHTIVPPVWHGDHHSVPELIYTSPPKGHPSAYLHGAPIHETYGPPSGIEHYDGGWENSGPGLGSEYISDINRVAQIDENSSYFKPHSNDANELSSWGLGTAQSNIQQQQQQQNRITATQQQRPPTPKQQPQQHHSTHSFNPFVNSDKQSIFGTNLKLATQQQQQQQASRPSPVYTPPRNDVKQSAGLPSVGGLNAAQIAAQYNPQQQQQQSIQQSQQHQPSPIMSAQLQEALRIQAEQRIVAQQQKILENQPFVQDGQPIMPKNYDPFYSPLLLKIDKILEQLGVKDDLCKERLVCSMYKDPNRYSPHSNFVSAELSRDTSELQAVTSTNQAVNRFYRLIQAARDGQEQRDCLSLYPQCNINTE